MGLFGSGGEDKGHAEIDEEIVIKEDGVSDTMNVHMELDGASEDVEKEVLDYKMGGQDQSQAHSSCADCDDDGHAQQPRH